MSITKKLYSAEEQSDGSGKLVNWNLSTITFPTRKEAEKAYNLILPAYNDTVSEHTWKGLDDQEIQAVADKVSFKHHVWVDENDKGFTLCASFDNKEHGWDAIHEAMGKLFPNQEVAFDHFTISQKLSDKINCYMCATHSVEIDIPTAEFNEDLFKKFKNSSGLGADQLLYADDIQKPNDVTRMKVYLKSAEDAQKFEKACNNAMEGLTSKAVVRKFPMAARKDFTQPIEQPQSTELPIDENPTGLEGISNTNFEYVTSLMFKHGALDAQTLCNVFFEVAIASQTETTLKADIIRLDEKDGMRTVVFSNPIAQSNMKNNFERLVNERLPQTAQNRLGLALKQSTNQHPKPRVA